MLTSGERFLLTTDVVAIEPFEERMRAVVAPLGNTVRVLKYPCADDDRMADVLWGDRPIVVFGRDLMKRAKIMKVMTSGHA